jgi:hypothetical protein
MRHHGRKRASEDALYLSSELATSVEAMPPYGAARCKSAAPQPAAFTIVPAVAEVKANARAPSVVVAAPYTLPESGPAPITSVAQFGTRAAAIETTTAIDVPCGMFDFRPSIGPPIPMLRIMI